MTTLRVWQNKDDKKIKAFETYGHAGFVKKGKYDIVCSAVSILTMNTIFSIEKYCDDKIVVTDYEKDALIRCVFSDNISHDAELLVKSMINGFAKMQEKYDKYIEIIIEEV